MEDLDPWIIEHDDHNHDEKNRKYATCFTGFVFLSPIS